MVSLSNTERNLLEIVQKAITGDTQGFNFSGFTPTPFEMGRAIDSWLICVECGRQNGYFLPSVQEVWHALEKQGYLAGKLDGVSGRCTITLKGIKALQEQDRIAVYVEEMQNVEEMQRVA